MDKNMSEARTVLVAKKITKVFTDGDREVRVLSGVDLEIKAHESLAILGSSGSGKSTLLQILSGLDLPSSGEVLIFGNNPSESKDLSQPLNQPLNQMSGNQRAKIRNLYFGFVYQFHHLLPEFTALENVQMPLLIRGDGLKASEEKAKAWLDQVGLSHRLDHKPSSLSGGERQRVAIARAMVTDPACLLADEPTGNLDTETAGKVFEVLLQCNKVSGTSLVIVTHDLNLASQMQNQVRLVSGELV